MSFTFFFTVIFNIEPNSHTHYMHTVAHTYYIHTYMHTLHTYIYISRHHMTIRWHPSPLALACALPTPVSDAPERTASLLASASDRRSVCEKTHTHTHKTYTDKYVIYIADEIHAQHKKHSNTEWCGGGAPWVGRGVGYPHGRGGGACIGCCCLLRSNN